MTEAARAKISERTLRRFIYRAAYAGLCSIQMRPGSPRFCEVDVSFRNHMTYDTFQAPTYCANIAHRKKHVEEWTVQRIQNDVYLTCFVCGSLMGCADSDAGMAEPMQSPLDRDSTGSVLTVKPEAHRYCEHKSFL